MNEPGLSLHAGAAKQRCRRGVPGWSCERITSEGEFWAALDESGSQGNASIEAGAVDDALRREGGGHAHLVCAHCQEPITSRREAIEVDGSHNHTFANPHGIVYRIGCFASASGARAWGSDSTEFAWFQGHAWCVAVCGRCGVHLGWLFRAACACFHGLIVDRLVEQTDFKEPS